MTAALTTPAWAPRSVAVALARARAARDAGIDLALEAASDWEKALVWQAIEAFAELGQPFSANNLRDLLPDVRTPMIGGQFTKASIAGVIVRVGIVMSTDEPTHHKPIGLWLGASAAARLAEGEPLTPPSPAVAAAHRALQDVLGPVSTASGNMRRWRIAHAVAAAAESALAGES